MQFSLEQVIDDRSNGLTLGAVIDINAHLVESHERPHAYSSYDQGIRSILVEQIDRPLAASLLVRRILHDGHIANFALFDAN